MASHAKSYHGSGQEQTFGEERQRSAFDAKAVISQYTPGRRLARDQMSAIGILQLCRNAEKAVIEPNIRKA